MSTFCVRVNVHSDTALHLSPKLIFTEVAGDLFQGPVDEASRERHSEGRKPLEFRQPIECAALHFAKRSHFLVTSPVQIR
jgi:hypothetical protein